MQRIGWLCAALWPAVGAAQAAGAGAELWRLAATVVPIPQALATGGAAAFWNPAQPSDGARGDLGIEAIQTPSSIGADGLLAALRTRAAGGMLGAIVGRMELGDLVRTTFSPDAVGSIPYY